MSAMRAQLSWLLKGRANTEQVLAALTSDLQALQLKVDGIDRRLGELAAEQETLATRQLDGFDAIRTSLNDAVDDLMARVAAVRASTT